MALCTAGCLPPPESLPRVGDLRVAARLAALVATLAGAALVVAMLPLFGARRVEVVRGLFRALLRTVGVRVSVRGPSVLGSEALLGSGAVLGSGVVSGPGAGSGPADGPAEGPDGRGVLVVSNHLSWLDVLALGALQPMRMVAKREMRDYPLLGAFAVRIGTLFIERSELRSLPGLVAEATEVLRAGGTVGLFPEGTTWCGVASGVFRPAGFQAALDAGVPVRPVAQRLLLPDGTPSAVGAFIGDDTVLDTLLRVVRLPGLVLDVQVLPLLEAGPHTDRRSLARQAELAIAAATGVPAPAAAGPVTVGRSVAEDAVPAAA
jgi:1-acyl-sn-glycerol-3-phosphate acyltransferase